MTDIPNKYNFKTYIDGPLTYNCRCAIKPITKEDEKMCNIKVDRNISINGTSVDDLTFVEILEYSVKIRKRMETEHSPIVFDQMKRDIADLLIAAMAKNERA